MSFLYLKYGTQHFSPKMQFHNSLKRNKYEAENQLIFSYSNLQFRNKLFTLQNHEIFRMDEINFESCFQEINLNSYNELLS